MKAARNLDGTLAHADRLRIPFGVPRATYWTRTPQGQMLVAETCTELLALPFVNAHDVDVERLAELAAEAPPRDPSRTAYRGIRRICPSAEVPRAPRGGTALERLGQAHDEAVARAVGGAKRVAVMGAGGLDSSALFATAKACAEGAEVGLFSLCFDGEDSDLPYLDALERRHETKAHRFAPEQTRARVIEAMTMDAQPYLWPSGAWELEAASRAKAWGAEVLLTGAGGDDVFGPWWQTKGWRGLWPTGNRTAAFYNHPLREASAASRACLEVAVEMPVREPYMDRNLVEVAGSLRGTELEPGGVSRGLLRTLMRSRLPQEICERQSKAAFTSAMIVGIYESAAWTQVRELGRAEALRSRGMAAGARLRERFTMLDSDPTQGALWAELWPAIVVEAFLRRAQAPAG